MTWNKGKTSPIPGALEWEAVCSHHW